MSSIYLGFEMIVFLWNYSVDKYFHIFKLRYFKKLMELYYQISIFLRIIQTIQESKKYSIKMEQSSKYANN